MKATQARTAAGASALVALAALLGGCTTLTDGNPTPTATTAESAQPGIPAVPDATPAVPSLVPEGGEVLLVELTGGSGSSGSRAKLEKAKTFVTWTCVGSGPITVSLGTLESSTAQCTDSGEATVYRNEFMNDTVQDVPVNVDARPGQQWKVIVSQVRKK